MNKIKPTIDKIKKYWKENKTLLIVIIVMFLLLLTAIGVWYSDTSKLELENQLIELERKEIQNKIEVSEAKLVELSKEKEMWKDSVQIYKRDKLSIKKEQSENRKKFNSDIEKVKKETVSQDQEWWDETGERLIKKWGL